MNLFFRQNPSPTSLAHFGVLVNAQVSPPYTWSISGKKPGIFDTLQASFDATFNTLTTENISQARREFLAWGESLNRRRPPEKPPVNVYFTTLTFNRVEDPARREKYHGLPTAALNADEVDALIAFGGELLQQSEPCKCSCSPRRIQSGFVL